MVAVRDEDFSPSPPAQIPVCVDAYGNGRLPFPLFQMKFPVTAEKIPVPRNIFPVNPRRDRW
jgi:hypothetical protein